MVSVDPSPRSAAWSRENFAANGLPPESHEFLTGEPRDVLGRIASSSRRFDLAVVDTPFFAARAPASAAPARGGKKGGKRGGSASKGRRPRHAKRPPRKRGKKLRMAPAGGGGDPAEIFRSGYTDLVRAAIGVLQPRGLLACTLHEKNISYPVFLDVLRDAAAAADVDLQVLEAYGLPADFPVSPSFPQGQYLKFLICALRP